MSNSFNISVAPEIAAVSALILVVDTVVDNIRATDVPNIQTNIDANETKIDANKTVVDAIQAKTDLIPQDFRGTLKSYGITTVSTSFVDVANITGKSGKILFVHLSGHSTGEAQIRMTIDGTVWAVYSLAGAGTLMYVTPAPSPYDDTFEWIGHADPVYMNLEFLDSVLYEGRSVDGNSMGFKMIVIED